ncbi:MAG: hypothetical protein HY749_25220 [Gammaproteobacteria bacterium]|nr:hypothetical protein [Gammaproteobacteria bacterium]
MKRPACRMAAASGVPGPVRTEIIEAFIILNDSFEGRDALAEALKHSVRTRLVEFVTSLLMTTTGRIMRRELRLAERRGPVERHASNAGVGEGAPSSRHEPFRPPSRRPRAGEGPVVQPRY